MNGYFIKVVTGLICISLFSSFLPKEGAGKNVLFCARILAVLLILSPVFTFRGIDIESILSFDTEDIEMLSTDFYQDAFCKTLEERLEKMLEEKGIHGDITIFAETDENGNIVGVSSVEVTPFTKEIQKEIAETLKIEETLVQEGV